MTEEFVSSAEIRDEMRKELAALRAEVINLFKERDDLKDALNHADDMVCMYAPEGPLLETYKAHVHAVMDGEPSPLRAELKAMADKVQEVAERNKALEEALRTADKQLDGEPEYHAQGMGCGLEDRCITDRYDAMEYGWDQAMERVYSEHINGAREVIGEALKGSVSCTN